MAGHAAGARPRAPLLEGSDLSPANANFSAWVGERAQGSSAGPAPGTGGCSLRGGKHLLRRASPNPQNTCNMGVFWSKVKYQPSL